MAQRGVQYPPQQKQQQPPQHQQRQKTMLLGWWGVVSIGAGLMAAAFMPTAMLDVAEGNWVDKLWFLSPMWAMCCVVGLFTGIRGCQFQARATKLQRATAFAGTLLSLFVFMVLTVIVTVMSS